MRHHSLAYELALGIHHIQRREPHSEAGLLPRGDHPPQRGDGERHQLPALTDNAAGLVEVQLWEVGLGWEGLTAQGGPLVGKCDLARVFYWEAGVKRSMENIYTRTMVNTVETADVL